MPPPHFPALHAQVATPRHDIVLVRRNGSTLPAPARSSISCDAALAASDLNEQVPGHSNSPSRCVNFSSNEPGASDEITQLAEHLSPASFRGTEGKHSQLHLSLIHQARVQLEGLLGNCCEKARENKSSTRSLALRDQKTLFAALHEELEQVKIQSRLRGTVIRGVSATEILSSPAGPPPEKTLKDPTASGNIEHELNDEFRGHNLSLMSASAALDGADRDALNAVYDWVRRADEHWTQSTEFMDAQLKHQEHLAHSKAAELDQCSQKCEMMERQLIHLKTNLEAAQARNIHLEAELKQALQDSAGSKQLMVRLLDAEHKLEIEVQRREEVEKCLEAERTQHLQDRADATAEGKEKQQQTQRVLEQVSWQGDAARLQLAAEQVRVKQAEQLSNELAQEVLSYKKQLDELQKQVNNLQSHQPRLLLHQVRLREHKLSSAQREERGAILTMSYKKWQREFLQSRRSVQCARFLTAVRLQRHRLSRKSSVSISNDDVSAWVAPWAPTSSHATYNASLRKVNHAFFRLPGAANGMGRWNGARLCASLDIRLLANAFEVFVDDARVARCVRRRSTQVEKSFQRGKIQLFLGSIVGCGRAAAISTQLTFPRRRLGRETKVRVDNEKDNAQHSSGSRFTQKNFAHNVPDSVSGRDDAVGLAWGGVQGVAFWLWYQTGKLARRKQIAVTRSLVKRNARLVATSFQAIKKFALVCEAIGKFDESKTVLATMKYFRHWLVFCKCKLALDKTWMHLVASVNDALLWKKKAQAMTLRTCWRRSLDAAVLLCTRAHSAFMRNDVLVRLALTEWRHTAILAALQRDTFQASRILRLISHAHGILGRGIDIGDGMLTLHDCTGNIVLKRKDADLLWLRIVWKKWVASLRHHHHQKESARKRKISVQQRHAHAMMLDVLCHWDVQSSTARQRCLFRRCTDLAGCVQSTSVSLDHSLHEVAVPSHSCTDYTADKLMVLSKAMLAWVHVRHWIDGVRLVCKFRLLSCHFSDWISSAACSRRQKRFMSITLQDRREKIYHRYFICWVDGVRSDKNRLSLLLSFAISSIQGVERPGFVRRSGSKCIGSLSRNRGTEVRKWTRLTSAGLKIGFLCTETRAFGLKIFKAEFFALWACRSLREYEISGNPMQQRLRAVRRRLDLWCAQIQQRRTHAAWLHRHVSYQRPQANALAAWRQVCTKSPRYSLMTKIIHQRARARKRILVHSVFVEWSQLAARTAKGLRLLRQVNCRRCILLKRWFFECFREGVKNDLEFMREAVEAKRRQFQGAIDTFDQGQPFAFHVARTSSVATEDFEPYLPRTLSAMSGVSRCSSTADLSRTSSGGISWNAILDTPASVTSPGHMSSFPLEDSTGLHSPTSSKIGTPDSARVGFAPPSFIPKYFGQVSTSSSQATSSLQSPILKRAPSWTISEQGLEDIPQRKLHPEGEATVFGIGSESAGSAVLRLWDYGDKERIQKFFTMWCRNTALRIVRKKKITKLARAMKEKFKRIQRGAVWRTCRSWFEQYNVRVALREERISDLKKRMDDRWLQVVFMDWAEISSNLSARLRLVSSRANEACVHLTALVLHCWCCYARQSASQRNRVDAKCCRNFHILKGSECLTEWLRIGKFKQSRRHKVRRQIAKARHKLLSQTFAEWFVSYNENRLEGLRARQVYQSQIICKAVALQRLFSRIRFAHTAKGFMAWEEWSLRSAITRRLLIKAQHRTVKIQKGTTFECWCCQTQVLHRQRANLNAVIVRTRNLSGMLSMLLAGRNVPTCELV